MLKESKELRLLLKIIKLYINQEEISDMEDITGIDFDVLREEARQHNCTAIIFPIIKQLQDKYNLVDRDLYNNWELDVVEMGAAQCIKNYEVNSVIEKFKQNNIQGVLFKGAVIADTYPDYLLRVSGDADILIPEEAEKKAIDILIKDGYIINELESKENVTVLYKGEILVIELHTSLWEDYKGEHIEKLEKMNITDKDLFIDFFGCDIKGTTLGITKHFTYIFYHMVKHFIPGGIGIRHLTDIVLFYRKYKENIDLNEFYSNMDSLGYGTFCKCIFKICVDMLGMDKEILQQEYECDSYIYNKLVDDVLEAGVFGNRTIERIKSRNVIKQTYYENDKKKPSKVKMIVNTLFPSAEAMSSNYVDARKHKILLPVAWTQRVIHHVVCLVKYNDEPTLTQKTKAVEDRITLLKELELFGDKN